MTEFPMNTRLYHDGLDLARFYSVDSSQLSDEVFNMLQFSDLSIDEDLQYADCVTQLLGRFEVRVLIIFGSLQQLREQIPQAIWERLNMGVCKLFYLHQVADWAAYAACIHEIDELLKNHEIQKRTVNDR